MKRIFFISIIGLALFSGACSKKNNPAAEQYQKAEELYRQGDYARAKVAIDSIAKIDPRAFDEIRAGMQLMRRVDLSLNLSCRKMKNIRKRVIMFSKKTGMPGVSTVHVCAFR